MIPKPLEQLMRDFSSLPGFGRRSAQKASLHLLLHPSQLQKLQTSLQIVASTVETCATCGNIGLENPCHICTDKARDTSMICVVEGVDDLWAMERTSAYKGLYHVLGGVVSAIDGVALEDLHFEMLIQRIQNSHVDEVILALGSSIDGQTTSHLMAKRLEENGVKISTLARGLPMGAEVDYMDEGTLAMALNDRRHF